ncbi:urease subunit gamma [Baekduia soli]|uniref:Urease subunit gamma n=1 Tax=Baekduia soli TaxID=496014 RepID=A0A5B8U301_9ACTN|nr:urease subunit gamma [Baekduia soli]QEC47406.1 urease subunit gamma [Baekduia soli]
MQLSPRELERLQLFTAAELARRRLREGVPLSHPDCVALACDIALEAARAGRSYAEVRASVRGIVRADQLFPGVAELLHGPLQVEATFGDGSRLVALEDLVAP